MELKGKVIFVGTIESGQSRQGKEWQKQGFAIKFKDGNFDKEAYFTLFGKAVPSCPSVGEFVSVQFMPSSREHNGRWYSELGAFKVEVLDTEMSAKSGNSDNLPF